MANPSKHGALVMSIEATFPDEVTPPMIKRYYVHEDGVILWELAGTGSKRVLYRPWAGCPPALRRDAAIDVLHEKWDELEARGYVVRFVKS